MKPAGDVDIEKLRLKMADLCSKSEQCEFDILTKLLRKTTREHAEEIITFLKEQKFINDKRYAQSFANDKMRFSRWGRRKIAISLRAKRIIREYIESAIHTLLEEEYAESLTAAAMSKARSLNLQSREDCQKLLRHLVGRGFEADLAIKEIKRLRGLEKSGE